MSEFAWMSCRHAMIGTVAVAQVSPPAGRKPPETATDDLHRAPDLRGWKST